MKHAIVETDWGHFGIVAAGESMVASYMLHPQQGIRQMISREWPDSIEDSKLLPGLQEEILAYFRGEVIEFAVGIHLSTLTNFQQRVLQACREIGYGDTASYKDLAAAAGNAKAARAVGTAMSRNPIPLIVPCHRIVKSDGTAGGFSSPRGTLLKHRMLAMENKSMVRQSLRRAV